MKALILETSLKQFLKYGIREISIQKLVEPLSISTKTVYKYFSNKEELLEHTLQFFYDQQLEMLNDLMSKKNTVAVFVEIWYIACVRQFAVNNVFRTDLEYYYPQVKKKVERKVGRVFTAQFVFMIERGMREGVFEKKTIPSLVVTGLYALLPAATRSRSSQGAESAHDTFLNTICTYIKGFCTAKGLQKLDEFIPTLEPLDQKLKGKL